MRQRKFRYLLVALLVVSGLLISGGEVRAAVFQYGLTTTPLSPANIVTSQTYHFYFTPAAGTLTIGYVDLEIPVGIDIPAGLFPSSASNTKFTVTLNGTTPLTGEVYGVGIGDFGTKFGVGDTRYRVMKVNVPSLTATFDLVLTIFGQEQLSGSGKTLGTEKGTVLIKAGNGSNTLSFPSQANPEVNTPALIPLTAPVISNITVTPNPVAPPECATITWSAPGSTVTVRSPQATGTDCVTVIGGNSASACFGNPGSYTIVITATSTDTGATSDATTTVTVNPGPLLETTCKQIRKNPTVGTQSCINLCLTTIDGARQEIASADWYDSPDCTGTAVPLNIYGEDTPEKTLVCAPCLNLGESSHPQACTTNTNSSTTPFLYVQSGVSGNPYKNCDVFRFEQQDQGFSAILGTDPWIVVNGRQIWVK